MPKARPMYSKEFKAEAVKLVKESGKPAVQISRDLGVSVESLKYWVKQQEIDSGTRKALPLLKRCEF
ncbi:MAG TPA: transposase [Thermosynergistes sp.]|nr:transposase [Thermosynergistes sp.]